MDETWTAHGKIAVPLELIQLSDFYTGHSYFLVPRNFSTLAPHNAYLIKYTKLVYSLRNGTAIRQYFYIDKYYCVDSSLS